MTELSFFEFMMSKDAIFRSCYWLPCVNVVKRHERVRKQSKRLFFREWTEPAGDKLSSYCETEGSLPKLTVYKAIKLVEEQPIHRFAVPLPLHRGGNRSTHLGALTENVLWEVTLSKISVDTPKWVLSSNQILRVLAFAHLSCSSVLRMTALQKLRGTPA